jgi:hypothetical protein
LEVYQADGAGVTFRWVAHHLYGATIRPIQLHRLESLIKEDPSPKRPREGPQNHPNRAQIRPGIIVPEPCRSGRVMRRFRGHRREVEQPR